MIDYKKRNNVASDYDEIKISILKLLSDGLSRSTIEIREALDIPASLKIPALMRRLQDDLPLRKKYFESKGIDTSKSLRIDNSGTKNGLLYYKMITKKRLL